MAPPNEYDENNSKRAAFDASTTISESIDYGDEPPRVLVGLNDAPVQAPDGALFKDGQLVEHKLEGEFDADKLKLVLRTIRKRLDDGYEALWKLQEKPIAAWGKDANEERWAQRFAERYA